MLQTGEFDYAWNMQVEDEILKRLESGGKGRVIVQRRIRHFRHSPEPAAANEASWSPMFVMFV